MEVRLVCVSWILKECFMCIHRHASTWWSAVSCWVSWLYFESSKAQRTGHGQGSKEHGSSLTFISHACRSVFTRYRVSSLGCFLRFTLEDQSWMSLWSILSDRQLELSYFFNVRKIFDLFLFLISPFCCNRLNWADLIKLGKSQDFFCFDRLCSLIIPTIKYISSSILTWWIK